jgi:hypothetical protein
LRASLPKWAGIILGISNMGGELELLGVQQKYPHNRHEICPLHPELRLRDIPGKSVQRWRHTQRFHPPSHGFPGQDPPRRKVIRIAPPPRRLLLPAADQLALQPAAGMLPIAYSIVGTEPTMTDATRTLPQDGHESNIIPVPSACSSVATSITGQMGQFWKADPGHFSKAPKEEPIESLKTA